MMGARRRHPTELWNPKWEPILIKEMDQDLYWSSLTSAVDWEGNETIAPMRPQVICLLPVDKHQIMCCSEQIKSTKPAWGPWKNTEGNEKKAYASLEDLEEEQGTDKQPLPDQ